GDQLVSNLAECSIEKKFSPFESLPPECAWKIIEYAPESAGDLRLTSSVLRTRVDEYARQNKIIPLCEELGIDPGSDTDLFEGGCVYGDRAWIKAQFFVRSGCSILFTLRLRRKLPHLTKRITFEAFFIRNVIFSLKFDSLPEAEREWERLVDYIGPVKHVTVGYYMTNTTKAVIRKLVEKVQHKTITWETRPVY
ncbi:hypothetical protein PMAYCL1PPCAC_19845, partial [Pristionchus mayeri]